MRQEHDVAPRSIESVENETSKDEPRVTRPRTPSADIADVKPQIWGIPSYDPALCLRRPIRLSAPREWKPQKDPGEGESKQRTPLIPMLVLPHLFEPSQSEVPVS